MAKNKKEKKEKIRYVDDGSSVADMSGVSGTRLSKRNPSHPGVNFKDAWHTYWDAVKMMFGPMLMVVVGLIVAYMIIYFIFFLMY